MTKKHQTVFSVLLQCFNTVFNQLSVFRCLTVYVVFKQAIQAIQGPFEKILVKKASFCQKDFFWYFVIKIIPKQFLVSFSFFDVLCSIFTFCVFWPFWSFHSKFWMNWSVLDEFGKQKVFCWRLFFRYLAMTITLKRLKLTFSSFSRFHPIFKLCAVCCICLLWARFNCFRAFLHDFDQKLFFLKKILFRYLVKKIISKRFLSRCSSFWRFHPHFNFCAVWRFGHLWASFKKLEALWQEYRQYRQKTS